MLHGQSHPNPKEGRQLQYVRVYESKSFDHAIFDSLEIKHFREATTEIPSR